MGITKLKRRLLAGMAGFTGGAVGIPLLPRGYDQAIAQAVNCPPGSTAFEGNCLQCPDGYDVSGQGACIPAAAPSAEATAAPLPSCPGQEYFSTSAQACAPKPSCPEGQFFYETAEQCTAIIGIGCFLTTACVDHLGLDDDCRELSVLRRFRDTWLEKQPHGPALIEAYYTNAPAILAAIPPERRKDVLNEIYARIVLPSVLLAILGLNRAVECVYVSGMARLMEAHGASRQSSSPKV